MSDETKTPEPTKPHGVWARELGIAPLDWRYAGARVYGKWEADMLITLDEFTKALDAVGRIRIGGTHPKP